jgi:hypothetical protein
VALLAIHREKIAAILEEEAIALRRTGRTFFD